MKTIVSNDDFNAVDLKPSGLLARYIDLAKTDVRTYILEGNPLKPCPCPACQRDEARPAFVKLGLHYQECLACGTIFIAPRPGDESIEKFYRKSGSRKFWQEQLSQSTDLKRKQKIIKPRCEWMMDSTQEHLPEARCLADIYMNHTGYVHELESLACFEQKLLVNPWVSFDNRQTPDGIKIVQARDWEKLLERQVDVLVLFEVLDRVADVETFMTNVHRILKPGGLCFITAILSSGFDIQTLWDDANNLIPPDRLNVFSVDGLCSLFDRQGYECLEFSTPGILDIELVKAGLNKQKKVHSRFVKQIMEARNNTRREFQRFLQANLLSSYGRVLIRKKER
ncbi:MAG: class I SAM-dependent methyltransferase [Candidatus Omnitrophica bacterium]|nr:class I SAM-dependent methyltransferase [Candidatus Omnitrophota bacterium]